MHQRRLQFAKDLGAHAPPQGPGAGPARSSEAKLRAQGANAQRSTGPGTQAGRRRSALNRRRIRVSSLIAQWLNRSGGLPDLERLFRDLLALFRGEQRPGHALPAQGSGEGAQPVPANRSSRGDPL